MEQRMNGAFQQPILVIGATGKTGRRVTEQLQARGLPVRGTSRKGEHPFDWQDPSTWRGVLQGVEKAYLTYSPDLAVPEGAANIEAFAKLALQEGVQRLVLLSGRGEDGALDAEQRLQNSGVHWTVVRASWFNQNFSENFLTEELQTGTLHLPENLAPEPFIDADDIAAVAVEALLNDAYIGQVLEVTGPELLTFEQAVAEISNAAGRDFKFQPIPLQAFLSALEGQGWPSDAIALMHSLFSETLDGRNAFTTSTVEQVLGRPAKTFAEYARETARTSVWNPVPVPS